MKWEKGDTKSSEARVKKLAEEVRSAAYDTTEDLWNVFLKVGELDMVRATERAMRLLVSHSNYVEAMKVLEGLYALAELAPSEDFIDCQQYPALAQMFMEEFLSESEDFLFDAGMDDVLDRLMDEDQ